MTTVAQNDEDSTLAMSGGTSAALIEGEKPSVLMTTVAQNDEDSMRAMSSRTSAALIEGEKPSVLMTTVAQNDELCTLAMSGRTSAALIESEKPSVLMTTVAQNSCRSCNTGRVCVMCLECALFSTKSQIAARFSPLSRYNEKAARFSLLLQYWLCLRDVLGVCSVFHQIANSGETSAAL
jgi:hypothetical protein